MQLSKPPHSKFIFHGLDEKTYTKYVETYSKCKKYGFRGISVFVAGTDVWYARSDNGARTYYRILEGTISDNMLHDGKIEVVAVCDKSSKKVQNKIHRKLEAKYAN